MLIQHPQTGYLVLNLPCPISEAYFIYAYAHHRINMKQFFTSGSGRSVMMEVIELKNLVG
jgi:propanediol dehydratase large subunit